MKLLFVSPYYAPAWDFGGPVRAASALAEHLVERGHAVEVWTSDALSRSARIPLADRCTTIHGVRVRRFPTAALRTLQYFNMFVTPGMASAGSLDSFDVVHLHEFRTFQNAVLVRSLIHRTKPYVLTPHGSFGRRGRVLAKVVYDTLVARRLVAHARFVTALTPREADDLLRLGVGANQIRILPNGVDRPPTMATSEAHARAQLRLPAEGTVILFLGRLHPIKGPDLLLDAFSVFVRSRPSSHLVLAGPDEGMRARLLARAATLGISSCVHLLGPLDGEAKEAAFAAAGIVVLPSRSEGLPVTLLEALARSKPVICTRACLFDPVVDRFVYAVDASSEALAPALTNTVASLQAAQERARSGGAYVRSNYAIEQIAATAEGIYREAIGA
jgi:glycosyltransferase involved in cell wall biosynthesis